MPNLIFGPKSTELTPHERFGESALAKDILKIAKTIADGTRSFVERRCREVLEKSVVEKCRRRVLRKSVGEECCGKVLERSVVQAECWREVLEKNVGEECCREVLVIAAQTKNGDRCTVM